MPVSKKRKIKTVELTPKELEKVTDKIAEDMDKAMQKTIEVWTNLLLMSLRDEFGFGTKRMKQLGAKFQKQVEALAEGYITDEDIELTLAEEIGINADNLIIMQKNSNSTPN